MITIDRVSGPPVRFFSDVFMDILAQEPHVTQGFEWPAIA
jgi:hypothetical protein